MKPEYEILTDREAMVLTLRDEGHTLMDLSKKFKVTRERIRQIEAKARRKVYMNREGK